MTRLTALIVLGSMGFVLSPATASAQFGPRNPGFGGPVIVPSFNPFFYVPQYRYQSNLFLPGPFPNTSISLSRFQYSVNPIWSVAPAYPAIYSQSLGSSYSTMGVRPNVALEAQRDLMRAQRAMSAQVPPNTSKAPVGEKPVAPAVIESGSSLPMPEGFGTVLAPADRARVLSGESLNELLAAIVKAEPKGGIRSSAFVPGMLLDEVRFGGSDAADALNLARRAGNLDFPAAFDNPALKDDRIALARDFAAVAERLQAGKAVDPTKRAQFEVTLQKVEAAFASIAKNLPADDATAAKRFLGQMANALKVMKTDGASSLIDPKWAAEGTTVADLVKHMTRHKLQFASAPAGNEESYMAMHRNFAGYLFLLTQPKK